MTRDKSNHLLVQVFSRCTNKTQAEKHPPLPIPPDFSSAFEQIILEFQTEQIPQELETHS